MGLVTAVLSGFVAALVAPLVARRARSYAGWLIALLPFGIMLYFASLIPAVAAGQTPRASYAWVPALGVNFSFFVDGLSLLFALLISGIGALIMIYAGGYLAGKPDIGRFYLFLLAFMASMLGLVLSDNVLTLFVFWELTSLASFLLVGFDHERPGARAAAQQALLVTGGGGLALMAGLVLLGLAGGSLEMSVLLGQGDLVRGHTLYVPILVLVLVGAFTKSAQIPFHFWLPSAMEAPTPVSAYLHSATMVKAGVYLLARLNPVLGGTEAWATSLTVVGGATMLVGAFIALYQIDLKRILAFSTISALGTLVLLIGVGSTYAIEAMVVFLLAHALYKGAFFMVAGAIDHETGTREVDRLGGLRRVMPLTGVITFLAALSLAGVGPLSFIAKELLLESVLQQQRAAFVLVPTVVLATALLVGVAAIITLRSFMGPLQPTPKRPHEAPLSLWLGPGLLAVLGVVLGFVTAPLARGIVEPAAGAILGRPVSVDLALWQGVNLALLLSGVSLAGGAVLYLGWSLVRRTHPYIERVLEYGPTRWYGFSLAGIDRLALWQTRLLQHGYLRSYLLTVVVTLVVLVGVTYVTRLPLALPANWLDVRLYELGIAALIVLATAAAVRAESRLAAVASLGVVGFSVAQIFLIFGAPDLAMTQVLIETLLVILFVLVLYHLPRYAALSPPGERLRDGMVAVAAGALMTLLVLAVTSAPAASRLTPFFAERSKPDAHGANIVNVILVDFRALDTLGEITVLALAAIGIYALLKLRLGKREGTP